MAGIEFDHAQRVWLLSTQTTSYGIRLTPHDRLLNIYWGPRIHLADAVHVVFTVAPSRVRTAETGGDGIEELPVEGELRYGQPSLSVRFGDQVRGIEWTFQGSETRREGNRSELELRFTDRTYPLEVTLHYRVYEDGDIIERWTELRHTASASADGEQESAEPIDVLHAHSASWAIPFRDDYRISHLHGHWGGETQLSRVPLAPASTFAIGSRTGITSHHANPWFAVDDGTAGEEHGEVWSGALAWSGSWRFHAQRFANGRASVSGGFGQDGFRVWKLHPGEIFETPVFAGVYSAGGFGAASREWHTYQLRHIVPKAKQLRPVLYNSWEATFFDINEDNQLQLAELAAEMGVELFVMDDGWFGQRTNDRAGLGDWVTNPDRFPKGLAPLISEVHDHGMQFGIWVEPEMVNPDSDLYRDHPDWVYHYPTRKRSESRNQLVLNLGRSDVAEWMYEWLHDLLANNAIDYVKWDMNRPFSEPGWPEEADNPERLWVDHVRNLYSVLDRLRRAHPRVAIESCAGGGGRVDFGILARTDMVWTSDNTDGFDRLRIQDGFTQVYAPRVMSAWVTDSPDHINKRRSSLRWRFHSAMAGLLGIGGNLTKWTEAERTEAKELIAQYKRIRPVVQHGLLYRLRPPVSDDLSAVQYVARDGSEVVVIAWQHSQQFGTVKPPLRLRGLDPLGRYRNPDTGEVWTGALLQNHGVPLVLRGDFDSCLIHLVRELDR